MNKCYKVLKFITPYFTGAYLAIVILVISKIDLQAKENLVLLFLITILLISPGVCLAARNFDKFRKRD